VGHLVVVTGALKRKNEKKKPPCVYGRVCGCPLYLRSVGLKHKTTNNNTKKPPFGGVCVSFVLVVVIGGFSSAWPFFVVFFVLLLSLPGWCLKTQTKKPTTPPGFAVLSLLWLAWGGCGLFVCVVVVVDVVSWRVAVRVVGLLWGCVCRRVRLLLWVGRVLVMLRPIGRLRWLLFRVVGCARWGWLLSSWVFGRGLRFGVLVGAVRVTSHWR